MTRNDLPVRVGDVMKTLLQLIPGATSRAPGRKPSQCRLGQFKVAFRPGGVSRTVTYAGTGRLRYTW
jgi:hypothetical protein